MIVPWDVGRVKMQNPAERRSGRHCGGWIGVNYFFDGRLV